MRVKRSGADMDLQIAPVTLRGYPIEVIERDELNAYADGKAIILDRRILSLVQDDNQLALVIGHELAHNALGHLTSKRKNEALGMAGGALLDIALAAATGVSTSQFTRWGGELGAATYSTEFEAEADYVGMYFITRADYPLDGVENVWRRFAAEMPDGIVFGGDHPTTPKRFVSISAAREEIEAAKAGSAQ